MFFIMWVILLERSVLIFLVDRCLLNWFLVILVVICSVVFIFIFEVIKSFLSCLSILLLSLCCIMGFVGVVFVR